MEGIKKSPLRLYADKWKDGCGSVLCDRANKICHVRGSVPCDVVFIGEAPGDSENTVGRPFVGPAGVNLQMRVIQKAIPHVKMVDPTTKEEKWVSTGVKYALMNLTGCIPLDEHGVKAGAPDPDDVLKCAPRLLELLSICKPKLIVCVGKEAETATDPWLKTSVWGKSIAGKELSKIPRITILHPAFILRQNISNQGLAFQRCALAVEEAIETYILNPDPPKRVNDRTVDNKPDMTNIPF